MDLSNADYALEYYLLQLEQNSPFIILDIVQALPRPSYDTATA
jgi:hypothetical protein